MSAEPVVSSVLQQVFPRRRDGRIEHQRWNVDLASAGEVGRFERAMTRLQQEIADMAAHFPRWVLTAATGRQLVACGHCDGMPVFDQGVRCVACGRAIPKRNLSRANLAWFGLLPPIGIDGLPRIKQALGKQTPRQHVVGRQKDIGTYLLVPLLATYPREFPARPVVISYLPGFFEIGGIPKQGMSHAYHMLDHGIMCLFAGNEWCREMTCRQVLQQRAYPHVIKFLNYGNGKRRAFAKVS